MKNLIYARKTTYFYFHSPISDLNNFLVIITSTIYVNKLNYKKTSNYKKIITLNYKKSSSL